MRNLVLIGARRCGRVLFLQSSTGNMHATRIEPMPLLLQELQSQYRYPEVAIPKWQPFPARPAPPEFDGVPVVKRRYRALRRSAAPRRPCYR